MKATLEMKKRLNTHTHTPNTQHTQKDAELTPYKDQYRSSQNSSKKPPTQNKNFKQVTNAKNWSTMKTKTLQATTESKLEIRKFNKNNNKNPLLNCLQRGLL